MNKPYIVCHMITSVDGRIDCAMTEHLPGVEEYYETLDALDAPSRVSGRVTAQLELARVRLKAKRPRRLAMRRSSRRRTPRAMRSWRTRAGRSAGTARRANARG